MSEAALAYEDFVPLVEERVERMYGSVYAMASPNLIHQTILEETYSQMREFFKDKSCKPHIAPFDCYPLADKGDEWTVVQPDIFMVCEKERLKMGGYFGAPPLIVEILSQNRSHDLVTKLNLYHQAGVKEYIVIDPDGKIVHVFSWQEEGYITRTYTFADRVPSRQFNGLFLNLSFELPFEAGAAP